MKALGILFKARAYAGAAAPPAAMADVSRFGSVGAFNNNAAWVQLPSGLWVLEIPADADNVDFGIVDALNWTTGPVSFEFWRYKAAVAGAKGIWRRGQPNVSGWYIAEWTTGIISLRTYQAAASDDVDSAPLPVETWYHIVCTRDNAGNGFIYANSVDVTAAGGALTDPVTHSNPAFPMQMGTPADAPIGMIGLPGIYSYSLSPAEIAKHLAAERYWFGV